MTLAFAASPAHASKAWVFKETFNPSSQPTFNAVRSTLAVDDEGRLYVFSHGSDTGGSETLSRWNADGTPADFASLGANVIDGSPGGLDATPQGSIGGWFNDQVAIDNSGGINDGNIYLGDSGDNVVNIFDTDGTFLGQLTGAGREGVTVDDEGAIYASSSNAVKKYEPAAKPPVNADNTASFPISQPRQVAAGDGPTDGYIFVVTSSGIRKMDADTGSVKYTVSNDSFRAVAVESITGNVFGFDEGNEATHFTEYDASGPVEATAVAHVENTGGGFVQGVAPFDGGESLYFHRGALTKVQVWEGVPAQEVETGPPALVSGVKATVTGTVRPFATDVTECYFAYGRTTAYGRRAPCTPDAASIPIDNGAYQVTGDLSGLLAQGATYHYRLVTNGIASFSGEDRTLRTANTYSTEAATAVTGTAATLNGTVKPEGVALTDCYFQYGENFPTSRAPCEQSVGAIGTGNADVPVSVDITGLDPSTAYIFRLVAVNPLGRITTAERRLTTLGPPIVFTQAARDVLQTSATLRARINPAGQPTTYFFEWGPDTNYGTRVPADTDFNLPAGTEPVSVNIPISGLQPQSTYYFRVTASNSAGRAVGPVWLFRTLGANSLLANPIPRIGRKRLRRCARGKVRRANRCVKRKKKAKRHSRRLSGAGMGARAGGVR